MEVDKPRHAVDNSSQRVVENGEERVTQRPPFVKLQADEVLARTGTVTVAVGAPADKDTTCTEASLSTGSGVGGVDGAQATSARIVRVSRQTR